MPVQVGSVVSEVGLSGPGDGAGRDAGGRAEPAWESHQRVREAQEELRRQCARVEGGGLDA